MLLLDHRFAAHTVVTDQLTTMIEKGQWEEFAACAHGVLSSPVFPEVLLVWSDVISLMNPDGGANAFGPPGEAGVWRPHAIALVDAAATRDLEAHRAAAANVIRATTPQVQHQLVSVLAGYVRNVFGYAGGREPLMRSARMHHACIADLLTTRQRSLIGSPASLITAIAANGNAGMAHRCLQRLGSASPDALYMTFLAWLRMAAAHIDPGRLAVDRDGTPTHVDRDLDAGDPKIRRASVFGRAVQLARRQDTDGLDALLARIEALPPAQLLDLTWHAAGTVAAALRRLLSAPDPRTSRRDDFGV